MKPEKRVQKLAQSILNKTASVKLTEDGIFGLISAREAAKQIPWKFRGSPNLSRWVAAVMQREGIERGMEVGEFDAFYGPQTDAVARILLGEQIDRPDEAGRCVVPSAGKVRCWYPSDSQMVAKYGAVGTNFVRAQIPYTLRLDWDLNSKITSFSCHRLVKDEIESIFNSILRHYGPERIRQLGLDRFGGCVNVRKKRGGSTWSTHSWGCSVDMFPTQNQMRWKRGRAAFARAEYDCFRNIWRNHGWMSLGECADFDWMHWQKNP